MAGGKEEAGEVRKTRMEKEDRISILSDAMIHKILSFVDAKTAVQTCILSKSWAGLWSTLTVLNFTNISLDLNDVYNLQYKFSHRNSDLDRLYCKFVSQFLSKRNRDYATSTFKIDFSGNEFSSETTINTLQYAIDHSVTHLQILGGNLLNSLAIKLLNTLELLFCDVSMKDWSLPSLSTLHLQDVTLGGNRIQGFNNLKELTLVGCFEMFSGMEVFNISAPNLETLTLCPEFYATTPQCEFVISAPKLLRFKVHCGDVPQIQVDNDGFCCLQEFDFCMTIEEEDWQFYNMERKKQLLHKLNCLFHACRRIKFLNLSIQTIQVLMRFPDPSEYETSIFGNLKSLSLLGRSQGRLGNPPESIEHVIEYLLTDSPCANIFVEDFLEGIKSFNPVEDKLLMDPRGYRLIKKQDTSMVKTEE